MAFGLIFSLIFVIVLQGKSKINQQLYPGIMKKIVLIVLVALFSVQLMAQRVPSEKKMSISAGVLQGGGGLVGADFEFMLGNHLSVQAGAGLFSCGAAINYHFKPFINSSMLSLSFWHQGFGEAHTQSVVSPVYTFRAPKVFQFQIGMGYRVDEGPNLPEANKRAPVMLLYSIGVYFPI